MTDVDQSPTSDTTEAARAPVRTLSWARIAALVLAFAWFGGAVGYFVGVERDDDPDAVDVGFLFDMSTHHAQAIDMALYEVMNGEDSRVLLFAREVLVSQNYEMGLMAQRLFDDGLRLEDRPTTAMHWMGMPVPLVEMPGLATEAQMERLKNAGGAEADRLFLELMSAHHVGGIHMSEYTAVHGNDPSLRDLAARMARNQRLEVNDYVQTAEELGIDADMPEPMAVPEVSDILAGKLMDESSDHG